ncbi:hypothetical protein [Lysobacter enzymogenes]|uniref:hypothetical protein n=1 Tax=Lysobacter enzymogenes TaxID=69 RepID=UPI0011176646|nr:hypothetical protein [Lysobacter enzymogenes]UZW61479.1 hypothetical protein BV903_004030 [Lysobacter enzymogenes]
MECSDGVSMRNRLFRIAMSTVFLVGCSTSPHNSAVEKFDARILIQSPAQLGGKGIDQVVGSLQSRYGVALGTSLSPLVNARQSITLDDGTVIVQTLTDINAVGDAARDVRVDVAARPCLPIARAAAWIHARRLSATPGSEVISGHVDYRFEDAQVRIDLTGEFGGKECLRVIEIYRQSRT